MPGRVYVLRYVVNAVVNTDFGTHFRRKPARIKRVVAINKNEIVKVLLSHSTANGAEHNAIIEPLEEIVHTPWRQPIYRQGRRWRHSHKVFRNGIQVLVAIAES